MSLSTWNSHSPVSDVSLIFHRGCVEFKWSYSIAKDGANYVMLVKIIIRRWKRSEEMKFKKKSLQVAPSAYQLTDAQRWVHYSFVVKEFCVICCQAPRCPHPLIWLDQYGMENTYTKKV